MPDGPLEQAAHQRIGSEVVARQMSVQLDKNYKYGRGIYIYIYEILVVTCYKTYGTPLNSTGAPVTRTRYALASEIDLLAGHACVLARLLRRGSRKHSVTWRCRMSWSVRCTSWGELFWRLAYSRSKEISTENLHSEPSFHRAFLALDYSSFS